MGSIENYVLDAGHIPQMLKYLRVSEVPRVRSITLKQQAFCLAPKRESEPETILQSSRDTHSLLNPVRVSKRVQILVNLFNERST